MAKKPATQKPPESETDDAEGGWRYGRTGGPNLEIKPSVAAVSGSPLVCLLRCSLDSAFGAVMGSLIGFGSGLVKTKEFKGSFAIAVPCAKTFAVMCGVHSLVSCILKRLRGKDDVINAGIAGCCTGLAFSFPGASPQYLLQSCLTLGAFSFIIEGLTKKQAALAHPVLVGRGSVNGPEDVLPPFTLALPREYWEGFSSFCQFLPKSERRVVSS